MSAIARLNWTWGALSVITVASWFLGSKHGTQAFESSVAITAFVVLASLVKVRFIIREFMEVRVCPAWIKWASDAWLVGVALVFAQIYLR